MLYLNTLQRQSKGIHMRVQPIRDIVKLNEIEERLLAMSDRRGKRIFLMFELGIYLSRRISDILPLRVKDLRGQDTITIKEKKTNKYIELSIPVHLQRMLKRQFGGMADNAYVLESRCRKGDGTRKPITRKTAYNDMKYLAKELSMSYNVGTHTLRKTFGYHYYQRTHDI
ncbi:site-specific recombinase [Clostridia bacterium]|nr:site-specific recombinase [Clostridia bacterium]